MEKERKEVKKTMLTSLILGSILKKKYYSKSYWILFRTYVPSCCILIYICIIKKDPFLISSELKG